MLRPIHPNKTEMHAQDPLVLQQRGAFYKARLHCSLCAGASLSKGSQLMIQGTFSVFMLALLDHYREYDGGFFFSSFIFVFQSFISSAFAETETRPCKPMPLQKLCYFFILQDHTLNYVNTLC